MKSRSITRTLRRNLIGGKLTATVGTGDFVSPHRGVPKIRLRGLLAGSLGVTLWLSGMLCGNVGVVRAHGGAVTKTFSIA